MPLLRSSSGKYVFLESELPSSRGRVVWCYEAKGYRIRSGGPWLLSCFTPYLLCILGHVA